VYIRASASSQYCLWGAVDEGIMDVIDIIEKPEPGLAPSSLAVAGHYILNASILKS
jgi:UTP-glucose-1-phosphate uridylyltransferase